MVLKTFRITHSMPDKQKGPGLFTSDAYTALRNLTTRRNYRCHFCYCDPAFNPEKEECVK